MKTAYEIEQDVFNIIKAENLNITGDVYKNGTRPFDSKKEDAVIIFLTGLGNQIQAGVVNVNVYVPDSYSGDRYLKDTKRCGELERILTDIADNLNVTDDYYFELNKTVQTIQDEEIKQHFVNCRLEFKLFNN